MTSRRVEIIVGLFIVLGMASLLMLALKVSDLSNLGNSNGYEVTARFDNVGGLKVRSQVSLGGVKVGEVSRIDYDDDTYEAVVTLTIRERFARIPTDSTVSIFTAGLLGEQFVFLEPGGEDRFLKNGSELKITQSALVIDQLIGQFLFQKAAEEKE